MTNPSLSLRDWPPGDQDAWNLAIANGGLLDAAGAAAHWADATRETNIRHYGRWLAFLAQNSPDSVEKNFVSRCTKEGVKQYVIQLQTTTASKTVASSIVGLSVMMKALAPSEDWSWLRQLSNRLERSAFPSRDKRSRLLPSTEIYAVCLRTLRSLNGNPNNKGTLTRFRNVLMLALLTACPIRRKNMAALRIGETLLRREAGWRISLPSEQVKNGEMIEFDIPSRLVKYLDHYIERVRPSFLQGPDTGRLWLNWYGAPINGHSLYLRITEVTETLFGVAFGPHLLRDCAATTLSTASPEFALSAPNLLAHTSRETTERYYVHAQQLDASRKVNALLEELAGAENEPA